jgi:hypothetical protein
MRVKSFAGFIMIKKKKFEVRLLGASKKCGGWKKAKKKR